MIGKLLIVVFCIFVILKSSHSQSKDCEDSKKFAHKCSYWAKDGECTKSTKFMNKYCKKSCDKCPGQEAVDCDDSNKYASKCPNWAEYGHCSKSIGFMKEHCKKSCNLCPTSNVPPSRIYDAVVLKGSDLPELLGVPPSQIFGHTINSNGQWTQVPIQIDEMHYQKWDVIKHAPDCRLAGRNPPVPLVYADPHTYSGPDEDRSFDENDELVFMARHLGAHRAKPNIDINHKERFAEVAITDPTLDGEETVIGYIYLFESSKFESASSSSPDAGQKLMNYRFHLQNGDYFENYKFTCDNFTDSQEEFKGFFEGAVHECTDEVMNPEDSLLKSRHYERHFTENWHTDKLRITAGNSDGENIFGMTELQLLPFYCGRSINSFIRGPTAFIANIDGPVRAIRSWVGANDGILTQIDLISYEQKEELTKHRRSRSVPGYLFYMNFDKNAHGMKYYNCKNREGFDIDGKMDEKELNFINDYCPWSMVTGPSGTLLQSFDVEQNFKMGDIGDAFKSWYYDNATPENWAERALHMDHKPKGGAPMFADPDGTPIHVDAMPGKLNVPVYSDPAYFSDKFQNATEGTPNGFHLCSALQDGQTEAWGTMGYISSDAFTVPSGMPPFKIPNADPTRARFMGYDPEKLSEGACAVAPEESLYHWTFKKHQFLLPPHLPIDKAEDLGNVSPFKPLKRFTNDY